jgi:high affinity choline transporter 7
MFQLLSAPFAFQNEAVSKDAFASRDWIGHVDTADIGQWLDSFLLLLFGGIPWQVFSSFEATE